MSDSAEPFTPEAPKPTPVHQMPSIGRMVVAHGDLAKSNGAEFCAAVITRVWGTAPNADGTWAINLTLFPDAAAPKVATAIPFYQTEAAYDAAAATKWEGFTGAFWPPRV